MCLFVCERIWCAYLYVSSFVCLSACLGAYVFVSAFMYVSAFCMLMLVCVCECMCEGIGVSVRLLFRGIIS